MKNSRKSSSKLLTRLSLAMLFTFLSIGTQAQEKETTFKLLTPEVVAQGESFTGTVVEETEEGFIPLKEGSQILVMGTVVSVGKQGKVEIPNCVNASGSFNLPASIVSIAGSPAITNTSIVTNGATFIPLDNASTTIEIWDTPDIINQGELITVRGTNLDELTQETLEGINGNNISLTEVSSSYFESQYLISSNLPEGDYRFSAKDNEGTVYRSEEICTRPVIEMQGPALKNVGQRGKITLTTNTDGVIILSGGLPIIDLQPSKDMVPLKNGSYRIPVKAGKTLKIPFRAQQVGQYTVTANMYSEDTIPDELLDEAVTVDQTSVDTVYDELNDETTITSDIEIISVDGSPVDPSPVEGVLSHPDGLEYITVQPNSSGIATITTTASGQVPKDLVSFYPLDALGSIIAQEALDVPPFHCNEDDLDEDFLEKFKEIMIENKKVWGNYSGVCGTALLEMAQRDPEGYAKFLEYEEEIADWLKNPEENDEEEMDMDEELRDIYKANKAMWGNYQGICGYALWEMINLWPELYEDFLKTEARIEKALNSDTGKPENTDENDDDDVMRSVYKANKKVWGNYQGICGTALLEMARYFPKLYQEFLENERKIEEELRDSSDKDDDGVLDVEEDINEGNSDTDEDGLNDESEQDEEDKKIVNPDAPKFKDERVTRAFESGNVVPYRTITIRLGGLEAGITKVGDYYFMTEEKSIVVDEETGTRVSYFDFTKGEVIEGELWYAIYLISLSKSPLNMVSRIVNSAESLGKEYLEGLMKTMKEDDSPALVIDIPSELMLLMHITVSFEMAAMPQLGDHVRSAQGHFEKALTAAENGNWEEAWLELQMAQMDMAFLMLELWPGGTAGKGVVKGGNRVIKPMVEVSTTSGRKMDEVIDALRTAAKNEPNASKAANITKKADELEKMASQSDKIRRAFDIGTPRPTNMATAAKDRKALENFFGAENVNTLGRKKPENVLVVTATAADGTKVKQVWVRPKYSDYKKAYKDVHGEIPDGCDIDHVQSRTRADQQGYGYVLVVPVDTKVNRSWGATVEKGTVQMGKAGHVEPNGLPDIRMIDQFQWWKLQRITPDMVKEQVAKNLKKGD